MSSQTALQREFNSICDICLSEGTNVCKKCLRCVCVKCIKKIYNADVCSATKRKHDFKELEKIPQNKRSADVETLSSQRGANVNEAMADGGEEWSCSRCTYLNLPGHRICVICAATRGVDEVEKSKPGSTVCGSCTLHNEEGTKVCVACYKTLDCHETVV